MLKKSFSFLNIYSKRLLSLRQTASIDWAEQEKILLEPFEHIQNVRSKYYELIRPSFNHWLKVPEEKLDIIDDAAQTMVTWIILLDDINDRSAYRYGLPSAHKVFGVGLTINAANKALFKGHKRVADLEHPLANQVLLRVHDEYFYGQGIDTYWGKNFMIPTEGEHIEIIKKKSGSWFSFPVELMQLFSTNKTNYSPLAYDIGTFYSLVDDYYNLFYPKGLEMLGMIKHKKHVVTSDITECKITLAVMHTSRFPNVATELADILKRRTSDPELMDRAIILLKKHGSDKYTRDILKSMEAEIRAEIDRLGGNSKLEAYMDDFCEYL